MRTRDEILELIKEHKEEIHALEQDLQTCTPSGLFAPLSVGMTCSPRFIGEDTMTIFYGDTDPSARSFISLVYFRDSIHPQLPELLALAPRMAKELLTIWTKHPHVDVATKSFALRTELQALVGKDVKHHG
jgi:hypothetical protein